MGMRGVEILMSSLGESLRHLDVDLPHFDPASVEGNALLPWSTSSSKLTVLM